MSIQTAFVYMVFTCLFSLSRTSGRSGTQTQRQEPGSDTPGGGPSDAPGSTFLRCAEGPAAAEGSAALSRCGGPGPGFGFATVCATPSAGSSAPPA